MVIVAAEPEDESTPAEAPAPAAARKKKAKRKTGDDDEAADRPAQAGSDELVLSSRYACTACGVSYATPEPQLFSFNSPQGACPACEGLGEIYGIDPDKLVTEPGKSLRKGALGILGSFRDMPRWMRRLFTGVAAHAEAKRKLPAGTLLDTPWEDLTPLQRRIWLEGTGLEEIRLAWKRGKAERGAKTRFEGILSMLGNRWRNAKSGILRRMLDRRQEAEFAPLDTCIDVRLWPRCRRASMGLPQAAGQGGAFGRRPLGTGGDLCRCTRHRLIRRAPRCQ
jgi:excinuclease ABC subunit A